MKKYLSIIFIFVICILLTGCGSNKNESSDTNKKIELTETENILFNRILDMDFYDSTSIKILDGYIEYAKEIESMKFEENPKHIVDNIWYYYVKIQANNKVGGTLTKCYQIPPSDTRKTLINGEEKSYKVITQEFDDVSKCSSDSLNNKQNIDDLDISRINKYFNQYWEEKGVK